MSEPPKPPSQPLNHFDAFKFLEEAAEKTKGHAWQQSLWVLGLILESLLFH